MTTEGAGAPTPTTPPVPPTPSAREERRARRAARAEQRSGVFGPVLLIVAGLAFLAANLGYLGSVSVGQLVQLWPVLLILGGIDLAVGRRYPLLAVVIDVVVLAAALVYAMQPAAFPGGRAVDGQPSLTVARGGARTLDLRITGGAARYTISGGATALVEATSDRNDLRVADDRRSGDGATVRIEQTPERVALGTAGADVRIRVASDVALTLRFDAGAGDFTVDLSDLRVSDARIATGASAILIVLPRPQGEIPVRIDAGASSITVEAPAGVEARVTASGFVTSRTASGRFIQRGNEISSTGFDAARDRVDVRVTAGVSSVTVR